jgi:hypothetical protein
MKIKCGDGNNYAQQRFQEMTRLGIYQKLERLLIKSFVYICEGLVLVHRHFLKPRNVITNLLTMRTLIIFITFMFSLSSFSQEVKPFHEFKLADSALVKDKTDILILKNDKKVQVITSRKEFIFKCKVWASDGIESFIKLSELINKMKLKEVNYEEINNNNLEYAFEKIFENLILENKCLVLNKSRKRLEKIVYVTQYEPNSDNFGLEYKTENKLLILKTVDYMGI